MNLVEKIKEKAKELNELFDQASKEGIEIKGSVTSLGIGEPVPNVHLNLLGFYRKIA